MNVQHSIRDILIGDENLTSYLVPIAVAIAVLLSGLAGLYLSSWLSRQKRAVEARDTIDRVSGLVGTLAALVLGLLIVSANNFYNKHRDGVDSIIARVIQLDGLLRLHGPETQPARDKLRQMVVKRYEVVWRAGDANPTAVEAIESPDSLFTLLEDLSQKGQDTRGSRLARAAQLIAEISDQRQLISLRTSNSLAWPLLTILVSWLCLIFFAFGLLSSVNRATVLSMAAGSLSVAGAIFLINDLNTPFSGAVKLPAEPLLRAIAVIGE